MPGLDGPAPHLGGARVLGDLAGAVEEHHVGGGHGGLELHALVHAARGRLHGRQHAIGENHRKAHLREGVGGAKAEKAEKEEGNKATKRNPREVEEGV